MKRTLYTETEPSVSDIYPKISKIIDSEFGLVKDFGRILQYYDEPKFWQYSATINVKFGKPEGRAFRSVASGVSFSSERLAIFRCLCESIERYCNHAFFNTSTSIVGKYKQIEGKALNPQSIAAFSRHQLISKHFRRFLVNENSIFSWTVGESLTANKKILVPSQLIYLSYPYLENEPTIYPGISTGTAGGSCLSGALVRGICEIIERDAFMIFYLNQLSAKRIDLSKIEDSKIQNLLRILKRYKMEIFSFDITTDISVPTFLSIVVDRTGFGKAVTTGLKTDLNQISALIGSIEETFNSRTWLRMEYEKTHNSTISPDLLKDSSIRNRGLLWYPVEVINKLDFLLKSPKSKLQVVTKVDNITTGQQLCLLVDILKSFGYDVIYKDITAPQFKKLGYYVSKVIIPQMQPFYLDEKYKFLGGERLYHVPEKLGYKMKKENELNSFPHPFL